MYAKRAAILCRCGERYVREEGGMHEAGLRDSVREACWKKPAILCRLRLYVFVFGRRVRMYGDIDVLKEVFIYAWRMLGMSCPGELILPCENELAFGWIRVGYSALRSLR